MTDHTQTPTAAAIPNINDSTSFLYLDRTRITQDDTGVCARSWNQNNTQTLYIPVATIATIVLGPGTTITTRALATTQRHGCTVVWAGDGGVRCYASATPETRSTAWLERQAATWADPQRRTEAVRRMFAIRFGDAVDVAGKTIEQMRGFEGARLRALYHLLAKENGVKNFKRTYNPEDWGAQSPVNQALSAANTCLYGITRAAIAAIGCSPSLGFLHSGKEGSFVYDIADLYKAEITIPLAFTLHESPDPEGNARRSFRERLHLFKLMPRIVEDIKHVVDESHTRSTNSRESPGVTMLWDNETGPVQSGFNYGAK